jgi:N-acetylglutamate synthase-like GNAT family acetyltransferase
LSSGLEGLIMYVRDAKNREEAWLLDHIEAMGLDDAAFRSRDYVVALDEETGEKAGFGRLRVHKTDEGRFCELTGIGVVPAWRGQGVGAHVVERLVETARDQGFDAVYSITGEPEYLARFGFEPVGRDALPERLGERLDQKREQVDPDSVATVLDIDEFTMPPELREAFKDASPEKTRADEEPEETPEDFGIDADSATYKYDTGGRT